MQQLVKKIQKSITLMAIIPLDHYTLLGISPQASEADIIAAHEKIVANASNAWAHKVLAALCGQSMARLDRAREELLNPLVRAEYDQYLRTMRVFYANPPS